MIIPDDAKLIQELELDLPSTQGLPVAPLLPAGKEAFSPLVVGDSQ